MNLIQLKESTEEKNRIEKLLNRTKKELTQEQNKSVLLKKELQKEFKDCKTAGRRRNNQSLSRAAGN